MNDDPIIEKLSALCLRFGERDRDGRFEVAKITGLSEQYLYQILSGKPMANGNARSIGKAARSKITAKFPDWLISAAPESTNQRHWRQKKGTHHDRKAVQALCDLADTLDDYAIGILVGRAEALAETHVKLKAKRAK